MEIKMTRPVLFLAITLALGCSVLAQTAPSRSYGLLITSVVSSTSNDTGTALLGILNLDGAGGLTGSYNIQTGGMPGNSGTFSGSYATNPDGSGTMSLTFANGPTLNLTTVTTDAGQGLLLAVTDCTGQCDLGGIVITGVARQLYTGTPIGNFGFIFNYSPQAARAIGVLSLDGAGNATMSAAFLSAGSGPDNDPHKSPAQSGTMTGTYSMNMDGTGTVSLPNSNGNVQTWGFVMIDGGAALMAVQLERRGDGVASGIARLQ
jgi:hypothetical protein